METIALNGINMLKGLFGICVTCFAGLGIPQNLLLQNWALWERRNLKKKEQNHQNSI
jgi:hypothetical protein